MDYGSRRTPRRRKGKKEQRGRGKKNMNPKLPAARTWHRDTNRTQHATQDSASYQQHSDETNASCTFIKMQISRRLVEKKNQTNNLKTSIKYQDIS